MRLKQGFSALFSVLKARGFRGLCKKHMIFFLRENSTTDDTDPACGTDRGVNHEIHERHEIEQKQTKETKNAEQAKI